MLLLRQALTCWDNLTMCSYAIQQSKAASSSHLIVAISSNYTLSG